MKNKAIALAIRFFTEVKGLAKDAQGRVKAPEAYKQKVLASAEGLLAGDPSLDYDKLITDYLVDNPHPQETYMIDDILTYYGIQARKGIVQVDKDNLIEGGKFYFHPQLQVAPPPPTIEILLDGSFKSSYENEEFFLEMKDKYMLDDLIDYFYRKLEIDPSRREKERDKGAFRHLLKRLDVDTVLYCIDEAVAASQDMGRDLPSQVFDIQDYMDGAMLVFEDRKNTCFMEGLDHVIPRSR